MASVFLFGNGLSIAADPGLTLQALTRAFLDDAGRQDADFLRGLVQLGQGGRIRIEDFEEALATVEILRDSIRVLSHFGRRSSNPHLRRAADIVRQGNIASDLDRVFWSYAEFVLRRVVQPIAGRQLQADLGRTLDWLRGWLQREDRLYFFTLNYDLLLERLLLNRELLDLERVNPFFR